MSEPPRLGLTAKHMADLHASGLNDETIRLAQVYSERDPEAISRLLGWEHPAVGVGAALVFPFRDSAGEPTTFARLKLDNPITRAGEGKPSKYENPRGRSLRVYFPPSIRRAVKDVSIPILMTEGEKKALCADQNGHTCIGLVGVWGWVKPRVEGEEKKPLNELHPDLVEFEWKGRTVYVAFDSDVIYKGNARLGEWQLTQALSAKGATVLVVRIPEKLGGPKVGLDDFVVARGPKAFDKLLETAGPPTLPPMGFQNFVRMPKTGKASESDEIPRSMADIAVELVGRAGGWPKVIGKVMMVPDAGGGVRSLDDHNDLFTFAHSVFDRGSSSGVCWKKSDAAVTPPQLYAHLVAECPRYDRAESLPHEPLLPKVYYLNPVREPGDGETVRELLDFFSTETDQDRILLLACLMTPLWGGPPGKRPAFLFEMAEDDTKGGVGGGKSTVAQKVAGLFGGAINLDAAESFPRTISRILTPSAQQCRLLMMDNIKRFRLSWAELEGLVTSPEINGHRLFKGQAGFPNFFTLLLTMNGASLARDFAQRVIPLRFTRAKYRAAWDTELDAFITANRAKIIADLIGVLRHPTCPLTSASRWALWERDVLSRIKGADDCLPLIGTRTAEMDGDAEDADRIRETLDTIIKQRVKRDGKPASADAVKVLLSSAATTQLVQQAMNLSMSAGDAKSRIKALSMPELRQSNRNGKRKHLWAGIDSDKGEKSVIELDYNPVDKCWKVNDPASVCTTPNPKNETPTDGRTAASGG